jgi:hypothetical protein
MGPGLNLHVVTDKEDTMFGILAAVTFGIGYFEQATTGHTGTWTSPAALTLLGLFFLALHLLGADRWIPRP